MDNTVLPANYTMHCLPLFSNHSTSPPFGWY